MMEISLNNTYRMCTKCVMDTTDPDIEFDENGVCNHCRYYDVVGKKNLLSSQEGERKLKRIVNEIKEHGKGKSYDCLLGLSGGVDSSFVAYHAKRLGLRTLIVHLDNGWDSEISVRNIENIVRKLNFDLYTYVIDWEEFRDLEISFLKASVIDLEMLSDHAIRATISKVALKNKIKYILHGGNIVTEAILPKSWTFTKWDSRHIKAIHKKYGQKKINTFPIYGLSGIIKEYFKIYRIRYINMLNYIDYNREKATDILKKQVDYKYYGKKHYESIITKFYQAYILPVKFNIDKRKCHLSTLICSGHITREQALEELKKPLYASKELQEDKEYILKKIGLSENEFETIMNIPVKSHFDYPNSKRIFDLLLNIKRIVIPAR